MDPNHSVIKEQHCTNIVTAENHAYTAEKALARLTGCAGLYELSLLAYVNSIKISYKYLSTACSKLKVLLIINRQ